MLFAWPAKNMRPACPASRRHAQASPQLGLDGSLLRHRHSISNPPSLLSQQTSQVGHSLSSERPLGGILLRASPNQGGEAAPNAELRPEGELSSLGTSAGPGDPYQVPRAFLISAIDSALRRRELAQIESSVKIRSQGVGAPGNAWSSALTPRVLVRHGVLFPGIWLWVLG